MKKSVAFSYLGGKNRPEIRNFILQNFPKHRFYLELFGGSAGILLSKKIDEIEVYNDIDKDVVNFFRTISEKKLFDEFYSRVSKLPSSRELYNDFLENYNKQENPVEKAVQWFYVQRNSFGGDFGRGWGYNVCATAKGLPRTVSSWFSGISGLEEIHKRFLRVQIECDHWENVLKRYSDPDYLVYCDPPYIPDTRKGPEYKNELTNSDHKLLVQNLLQYPGAAVLSGYDSPIYKPLEDNGWSKKTIDTFCFSIGTKKTNKEDENHHMEEKYRRVECIWVKQSYQKISKRSFF